MKIYTKVVLEWNPDTQYYERVEEESYEYEGPLALCGKDGGGDYSPPPPPDPNVTAAAQGAQDRKTAQTNALLLNPNVVSPYGNIGYDINNYTIDGENIQRPTQTTVLSQAQQNSLNSRNQISDYLNNIGINLAQQLPNNPLVGPSTPTRPTSVDYSNVAAVPTPQDFEADRQRATKAIYDQQYNLMKPDLDLQRQNLENQLAQTGNPMGSESYNNQMDRFSRNYNNTLQQLSNQAITGGYNLQNQLFNQGNVARQQQIAMDQLPYNTTQQMRSDQISENQLLRNQQINELSNILLGRESITLPIGANYNQAALRAPDLAGLTQSAYNSQLQGYNNAYNAQQQSSNAATSGLFSLASAAVPFFF
jgi:hypothetical protein